MVELDRCAILNSEELEKHAKDVACDQAVSVKASSSRKLLPRMENNYKFIIKTYKELNNDVKNRKPVIPAAEWLFDNFYVIEEQVKEIRLNFPRGYYAALPRLKNGILKGFPRVYGLAMELVSHTDGRIDEEILIRFLKSYQSKSQLTSGELWAVSMVLRIALIENIRHICNEILEAQYQRDQADRLADIIFDGTEKSHDSITMVLEDFTKNMDKLSLTFAEHLLDMVRKHGGEIAAIMHYIDDKLAFQDTDAENIINLEHQQQAQKQMSIGNSITSLRFVSTLDWSEIFELLSPVEHVLRQDPADVYRFMNFNSRDYYRHEIEKIARTLKMSETQIARKAVECAQEIPTDLDFRKKHVGYYLIGKGRRQFESLIEYKAGFIKGIRRFIKKYPTSVYFCSITIIVTVITVALSMYTYNNNLDYSMYIPVIAMLAVLLPASDLAVGIVNWVITHILKPSILPKLELKEGIPQDTAAMIVVPTLLSNTNRVKDLLGQLEVYYLANRENNLFFALLGDFIDAKQKDMQGDDAIIKTALSAIKELNKKYCDKNNDIFYFFHRYRKFNPSQGVWMGWERKRGKLEEFNELLRGSEDTTYYIKSGDITKIPQIKYVITLDADTELPRNAAKKLIGTISHPLNKAIIDEKSGRVVEGYGILQPRVSIGVTNANKSMFSRIFAGQGGIDPYTTAVSDVYQDLFGEGIFTGKGIYDVDIFRKKLRGYIPENTVLSHDLLEGSYTRAGLVTDIELVDGFPSTYSSYTARLHRWVRGDWQLLPWLFPRVKKSSGEYIKNPLSLVSRWKIFDNMRRSLIAPSLIVLIFLGLSILPGNSLLWFGFVVLAISFPVFADMADVVLLKSSTETRSYNILSGLKNISMQILLIAIFLPYQAYLMLDAIIRTLARLIFTKKNMLEWETAADAEARLKSDKKSCFARMWIEPATSALLLAVALSSASEAFALAVIFIVLWTVSPLIAFFVSMGREEEKQLLGIDDISELRRIARMTWRYFEDFAGPSDNYLPPDNYQEEPKRGVAHRTSPTNIGLLLVSTLSARDFGYICTTQMIDKIGHIFASIKKLDTWKGNLYNWYDTITLAPLRPLYVSTVDSGNMIGYLMTLNQGMEEYVSKPLIDDMLKSGLIDTLDILSSDLPSDGKNIINLLKEIINASSSDPISWSRMLDTIKDSMYKLNEDMIQENCPWYRSVDSMIISLKAEITEIMGWVELMNNIPELLRFKANAANLTGGRGGHGSTRSPAEIFKHLTDKLCDKPSLRSLSYEYNEALSEINSIVESLGEGNKPQCQWLKDFKSSIMKCYLNVNKIISNDKVIRETSLNIVMNTDFKPLYDEKRQLFSIGFSTEDEKLNRSYYDLLASEARQTSLIAIAKGDVIQDHWFRLGRPLSAFRRLKGLVSWGGTMFEYLMPLLIMKNYKNTLLDETYKFVIKNQIEYGRKRHVPWGVSESGYNAFDINLNYQYKAFGVPRLGLKRGLIDDMVVAPYATILALQVDLISSMQNIRVLKQEGLEGSYGLYEAVDYTPERLPMDKTKVILKSFMAHHHGMSLLSINNCLNKNIMQERFHRDPLIKAAELLLQEKVPNNIMLTNDIEDEVAPLQKVDHREEETLLRIIKTPNTALPEAHIISNGNYCVLLTNSGTGYSKFNDIEVSRWREDRTIGSYGMFFYIQNINSNMVWSAAYEPYKIMPEDYSAIFSSDKVEYSRVDGNIDTHTEIVVSPEDNVEVRRISITNHSDHARVIEVTSYFEVVLSTITSDIAHTMFNNLFIQTEFLPQYDSLIASRRPRMAEQSQNSPTWLIHTVTVEGETIGGVQYETDRNKFIGRNRDVSDPEAMDVDHPLSNTAGSVIDPIMSLRRRVRIQPGKTVRISYITGTSENRHGLIALARKYHDISAIERAFELAWTRSQVELRYLNLMSTEVELYQRILPHILYISPLRKAREDIISKNSKGQSGLWPYGISGDNPVILLAINKSGDIDIVYELLKMHEYFRLKGFMIDIVILNEDKGDYYQSLHNILHDIILSSHASTMQDRPGGVFLRQSNIMSGEDINLLYTIARIVFKGDAGVMSKQLKFKVSDELPPEKIYNTMHHIYGTERKTLQNLIYYNSLGGFSCDGREYIIHLSEGEHTPAPWSNVISNENFGCLVTESGLGYTWAENSREFKITPWSNDPVVDPQGETVYLRDEEDGMFWSTTPLPVRESESYYIRHGFGYSVFEHTSHGINQEMTVFVPEKDNVKLYWIKLKNLSGRERNMSAIYYMRPVLGVNEQVTAPYIVSSVNKDAGTLLIKNTFSDDFKDRVIFIDCSIPGGTVTGDRDEFIGRNRSLETPIALRRENLSGRLGAGFDPCAAMHVSINLKKDEEKEFVFILGQELEEDSALSCAQKYKNMVEVHKSFDNIRQVWNSKLSIIQVSTPDKSLDIMMNGWLMYQTISCRLYARSAFYQSGGAYGFRDQLQDVMAVSYLSPDITKKQILHSAQHQFLEGDVQHWWHPVTNKGIRTKFSDDLLWLPYVTADYIETTGDISILEISVPYLEDEELRENEDERYNKPQVSQIQGSLYEHCIKSIIRSLKFGEHGIPLMGSGDWNDGMSTVGNKGRGESIWLGWFMYSILTKFTTLCKLKGDEEKVVLFEKNAIDILNSIEEYGWDGSWYRRAYFDDGTPLGSATNHECQIDSIAQTWSAISNGGRPARVLEAMSALEQYLVIKDAGLIKLLTPAFDSSNLEPGYIKAYVPGVRENGGQYTHAAVWVILAFAKLGNGNRAWELFNMINPINHSRTPMEYARYKVEPYVMAADVYGVEPYTGRGGWSWYTGASGWMYRVGIEHMLGFKVHGDKLVIDPCIPKEWREYSVRYLYKNTVYIISIKNPNMENSGVKKIYVDTKLLENNTIPLIDDRVEHHVDVLL